MDCEILNSFVNQQVRVLLRGSASFVGCLKEVGDNAILLFRASHYHNDQAIARADKCFIAITEIAAIYQLDAI